MIEISNENPIIRLYASDDNWIEGEAFRQLEKTAGLEGMEVVVGMPDLHPGSGSPVGAAFIIRGAIYPYLVGNDVGCGVGLWSTTLKANKTKRDKWVRKLSGLERPWDGDSQNWLNDYELESTESDHALGTIGGGNHFAELQIVEKIYDREAFEKTGLNQKRLVLLIHSGSRSIGDALLRQHTDKYGAKGLREDSDDALKYLNQHDYAVKWAEASRALIAHRFIYQIGGDCNPILDMCHNSISNIIVEEGPCWVHRKGAVPADFGPVVVPGSRGTLSYLVKPTGSGEKSAWSLAHGAGRKWNRKSCKGRLKAKHSVKSLSQIQLGSSVICEDKNLLFEEAPQAYKNIDTVIKDMIDDKLISLIAAFRPLITYKTRDKK